MSSSNAQIVQMLTRYPFGRCAPNPSTTVRLVRRFEYNQLQELHDKIEFLSSLKHSNIISIARTIEKREELSFEVYFEYVPRSLRECMGALTEEELEHGRSSLYHLCSYLISNNVNPEIAEELIGVDQTNQLKLFVDIDFRVLTMDQNRTDIIRAKRVEINAIIDHYLSSSVCSHKICRSNMSKINGGMYSADFTSNYFKAATVNSRKPFGSAVPAPIAPYGSETHKARMSVKVQESKDRGQRNSNSLGIGHRDSRDSSCKSDKREVKDVPRSISGVLNMYLPLPRMSETNSQNSQSSYSHSKKPKMSQFAKYSNKPPMKRHQPSIQLGLSQAEEQASQNSNKINTEYELPLNSEVEMSHVAQNNNAAAARPSRTRYQENSDSKESEEYNQYDKKLEQVPKVERVSMRQTTNPDFFKKGSAMELPWTSNKIALNTEVEKQKQPFSILNNNFQSKINPDPIKIEEDNKTTRTNHMRHCSQNIGPGKLAFDAPKRLSLVEHMAALLEYPANPINERVLQSLKKSEQAVNTYSKMRRS